MEHTPGPWKAKKQKAARYWKAEVRAADNQLIAVCYGKNTVANAHLIKAAPELKDACLTALGVLATLDQNKGWVKEITSVILKALENTEEAEMEHKVGDEVTYDTPLSGGGIYRVTVLSPPAEGVYKIKILEIIKPSRNPIAPQKVGDTDFVILQ